MATTTQKAIDLAGEMRNSLQRYFTTVGDVTFDTDGNPFFTVTQGTLAAGQQAAVVKVTPVPSINVDGLGLAQKVYATHYIQVVLETSTIAHVALMTEQNKVWVYGETGARNCRFQLFLSANTVAVSTAAITGTPEATWDGPDLKFRLMINS